MRKRNEVKYWETLDYDADSKFEELTQNCLNGKITIEQMFKEMKNIQYDCPESDICKETINKVFEFIEEHNLTDYETALKLYEENYY